MALTRDKILTTLRTIDLPDGGNLVDRDMVRALSVDGDVVRFVIEASAELAPQLAPVRAAAESAVAAMRGVGRVQAVLTAHAPQGGGAGPAAGSRERPRGQAPGPGAAQGPGDRSADTGRVSTAPGAPPPGLRIGGHPTAQSGPMKPSGVDRILAVASGKGGVGKSTVSANLAVTLARQGRRVGLLDADIYGPSQPHMMGVNRRPSSPDGKIIEPLHAHGVTMMSIGLMVDAGKAVVWRGPMLMGALQQMISQVAWGELDVLIVDLPPGTGDVQLTLCQRVQLSGAIVVSTPQDVALLDARKAMDMFATLKTPVLGLIENMSTFICPHCGGESHPFGHGGVAAEADRLGLPFLGSLPLDLATREAGDAGAPVALRDGPQHDAYAQIAARLVKGGMA